MKNIRIFIFILLLFYFGIFKVSAKDTLFSINKYKEENFNFIKESYNKSGSNDGLIVAGEFLKAKENNQIIIEKFNFDGQKIWEFKYKNSKQNYLNYLTYTYNLDNQIDGYLISILEKDSSNTETSQGKILKIDLKGKLISEKTLDFADNLKVNKILPIFNNNNFDGYILTINFGENTSNASLVRFDKDLNIIFRKDQINNENKQITYEDLIIINNNNSMNFLAIENLINNDTTTINLVKFDKNGNKELLKELPMNKSYNLMEYNNGYILYGLTKDVKVSGGTSSYYLINYDLENKEIWESVGDIAISEKHMIKLFPIKEKNTIKEFLLMYKNKNDLSYEVIKLDTEGLLKNKIKKINNEYYNIKDFFQLKDVLYFVGNITCPEEDSCNYDTHSLLLRSDEDKVIEVKDNTVRNISIFIIILILIITFIFIKRKRV